MKGKTNSALGGGGSGGGELIFAENALNKDSVEAGEKVLLRRFTASPQISGYEAKYKEPICSPILKNRFVFIEDSNSGQYLATIEDDLTFKKITKLLHTLSDYTSTRARAIFIDGWIFYGDTSRLLNAVNIDSLEFLTFSNIQYSGCENYFFTKGTSVELCKFNTQTGDMEKCFTVLDKIPYQFVLTPLLLYKDILLTFYYISQGDKEIFLYKLNQDTGEKEELAYFADKAKSFSAEFKFCFPLTPTCCCLKGAKDLYYVIKIDESCKTFYVARLNCLGFENDISSTLYNTSNRTFTIIKQEESRTFLNILKFDPENWKKLEFVEKIDLTDTLESFKQSAGVGDLSIIKYQFLTEDLNRLNLVLYDKSSYYNLIINLKNNFLNWQIVPDFTYNYNEATLTAITTGKTDDHQKIEVKTTLPEKIPVSLNTNNVNATITVEGVNP